MNINWPKQDDFPQHFFKITSLVFQEKLKSVFNVNYGSGGYPNRKILCLGDTTQKYSALLTEGFIDKELRRLCYDVSEFKPVYDQLAENTDKAEKMAIQTVKERLSELNRIEIPVKGGNFFK